MEPLITASLISAGSSLLGGLFKDDAAEDAAAMNQAMQREFAQHGIRWRVEDAKAAGVHPLYALGSGVTPFSPSFSAGEGSGLGEAIGDMGQSLSRAVAAQSSSEERSLKELQLRLLESQIGEHDARASYYRSAAVGGPPAANPLPMAGTSFDDVDAVSGTQALPYRRVQMPEAVQLGDQNADYPGRYGVVKPKAVEIESANPNAPWTMAGGGRPGWQRYRLTSRMSALMPPSEEGWPEGFESMPKGFVPLWLMINEEATPGFWRLALQEFGGNSTVARWVSRLGLDEFGPRYRQGDYVPGTSPIRR